MPDDKSDPEIAPARVRQLREQLRDKLVQAVGEARGAGLPWYVVREVIIEVSRTRE